jgi:hypothetical protein
MNAPNSKIDEITIESVANSWLRVTLPDGDVRYVAGVSAAGITLDFGLQGNEVTLRAEADGWSIDGKYEPTLLIESPTWYSAPNDDADGPTDKERKPCGEYHPLPCGLDVACPETSDEESAGDA